MLSAMGWMHGVRSKKATGGGGGGGDVTPNAVSWADVFYNGMSGAFFYSERQITGIDTTITLKVTLNTADLVNVLVSSTAHVIVNGDDSSPTDPYFSGFVSLYSGDTFTVSNNDYVTFTASSSNVYSTVTVTNESDGGAQIDVFDSFCLDC